jgi:hypothetical protein
MIFRIRILFKSKEFSGHQYLIIKIICKYFENDEQLDDFLADIDESLDDPAPILKNVSILSLYSQEMIK